MGWEKNNAEIRLVGGCIRDLFLNYKNVAAGCVFGEIFFEDCKAGAAVTGAATIIDGQN